MRSGSGKLTFDHVHTHTGTKTIDGGTLTMSGGFGNSTTLTIADGATYNSVSDEEVGWIVWAGNIN